jgi:hypothetical protein
MPEHTASRRAILAGAAGLATVGAISTAASAACIKTLGRSPELLRWRAASAGRQAAEGMAIAAYDEWVAGHSDGRYATYNELLCGVFGDDPRERATALALLETRADKACDALDEEWKRRENDLDASVEALIARPVRSIHDLAKLVEVLQTEQLWLPGNKRYEDEIQCRELDALFAGIEALAKGGANV